MDSNRRVAIVGWGLALVVMGSPLAGCNRAGTPQDSSEEPRVAVTDTESSTAPQRDDKTGMKVWIDPQTGRPGVPPPEVREQRQAIPEEPAVTGPGVGEAPLIERPSEVPGGGVVIELGDRFRVGMRARADADGKPQVQCEEPTTSPHGEER